MIYNPQKTKLLIQAEELGIKNTLLLSGDRREIALSVSEKLGIDECYFELMPQDKVEIIEKKLPMGRIAFVGDGINDAPVLARADVGISMGGLGSDAAIEASDIVLLDESPMKVAEAVRIARKTTSIVKQNILFSLGIKGLALLLAALGLVGMRAAIFADVGVMVLAIFNSMRTLKIK